MRKSEFLTPLVLEELSDGKLWRLAQPLVYYSSLLSRTITVPAGFTTDLASVPRLPLVYVTMGGRFNAPAVVHDFLYHNHNMCSREQADGVLREAMQTEGHNWFRRSLVWAGVRLFGWKPYDEDEMEDVK